MIMSTPRLGRRTAGPGHAVNRTLLVGLGGALAATTAYVGIQGNPFASANRTPNYQTGGGQPGPAPDKCQRHRPGHQSHQRAGVDAGRRNWNWSTAARLGTCVTSGWQRPWGSETSRPGAGGHFVSAGSGWRASPSQRRCRCAAAGRSARPGRHPSRSERS